MTTDPIAELLSVLDSHLHYLTSARARIRRQLAAAGLARCRALLEGIVILREAGRTDVMGLLHRGVVETWLVALYVRYGGKDPDDDSVLLELAADHLKWSTSLVRRNKMEATLGGHIAAWSAHLAARQGKPGAGPTVAKLNLASIAERLRSLLASVEEHAPNPVEVYDTVYRAESQYSAHPGVGGLLRYLRWGEDEAFDSIGEKPGPAFPGQDRLSAILTAYLAKHVFRAFDVDVQPIEEAFTRLSKFDADADGVDAEDEKGDG